MVADDNLTDASALFARLTDARRSRGLVDEDYSVDLDIAKFKGVRNIYFVFTKSQNAYFDAWQFTENLPDGITTADVQDAPSALYDLSGRRLSSDNLNRGIVIEKYKDSLGTLRTRKRVKSAK